MSVLPVELSQCLAVVFQILQAIGALPDVSLFQETIEFEASQSEQRAGLIACKRIRAAALDGQGFESFAARIRVIDDITGELDSYSHSSLRDSWVLSNSFMSILVLCIRLRPTSVHTMAR